MMANNSENLEAKDFQLFNPDDLALVCLEAESILTKSNQSRMYPLIQTVIIELVMNSFKAIDKRDFFQRNGLNLVSDYKMGMEIFKRKFHEDQDASEEIIRVTPVLLKILYSLSLFKIEVETKIQMNEEEKKAVENIIQMHPCDLEEIEIEGGGIGINMILSILANLNLNKNSLNFHTEENRTVFSLTLNF